MPIEVASSRNFNQYSASQNSQNLQSFQNPNFENYSAWVFPEVPERTSNKLKLGVFSTTFLGVATAFAILAKSKGASLNLIKILKEPITKESAKSWSLYKMDYKMPEILSLGAGSILGGLLGGVIFDKRDNLKAKFREALIQYVGNICAPLTCIGTGIWAYQKYKEPIMKHRFSTEQLKWLKINKKYTEELDKLLKKGPKFAITALGLVTGVFLGNKIGNILNEEIFKIKDNRKLKATDMSPHIDDVCYAVSLADENNPITHAVSRVVPAALMIAGYQTGITKEKPQILEHERQCHNCKST